MGELCIIISLSSLEQERVEPRFSLKAEFMVPGGSSDHETSNRLDSKTTAASAISALREEKVLRKFAIGKSVLPHNTPSADLFSAFSMLGAEEDGMELLRGGGASITELPVEEDTDTRILCTSCGHVVEMPTGHECGGDRGMVKEAEGTGGDEDHSGVEQSLKDSFPPAARYSAVPKGAKKSRNVVRFLLRRGIVKRGGTSGDETSPASSRSPGAGGSSGSRSARTPPHSSSRTPPPGRATPDRSTSHRSTVRSTSHPDVSPRKILPAVLDILRDTRADHSTAALTDLAEEKRVGMLHRLKRMNLAALAALQEAELRDVTQQQLVLVREKSDDFAIEGLALREPRKSPNELSAAAAGWSGGGEGAAGLWSECVFCQSHHLLLVPASSTYFYFTWWSTHYEHFSCLHTMRGKYCPRELCEERRREMRKRCV